MTTPFLAAPSLAAGLAVAVLAGPALADPATAWGPQEAAAPPHARPGQCFRRVERAPLYDVVRETVVDQPARADVRIVPAQYRWEERQVLVAPGRTDEIAVPEVSHEVSQTIVVRPPSVRVDTVAPVYDTVMQQVLVAPGRTYWKPSMGPTGEILCLVSEPPLYAAQPQTVLREPGRIVRTPIPGENRVVVRRVIDAPARVERRDVAPVYRIDRVRVLVAPERAERTEVPATYRTVERQRLVFPGGSQWREIACAPPPPCAPCAAPPPPPAPPCSFACDADPGVDPGVYPGVDLGVDPGAAAGPPPMRREGRRPRGRTGYSAARPANMVAQIQTALRRRGYYRGPVDGLYTAETGRALGAFERSADLPPGPPTPRVARLLGVY